MMLPSMLLGCWIAVCCLHVCGVLGKLDSENPTQCNANSVCSTLMRYRDNTTVNEGPNCVCAEGQGHCPESWEDKSHQSMTWQHYERAHWSVQYKFCTPLWETRPECDPGELAAVVDTDVRKWEPVVSMPRCRCKRGGQFKMSGWKRDSGKWRYYYYCEKPVCHEPAVNEEDSARWKSKDGGSLCARIYLDSYKSNDRVNEMEFLCSCPEGHKCPAKFDEKEDTDLEMSDEAGRVFVPKFCLPVIRRKTKDNSK